MKILTVNKLTLGYDKDIVIKNISFDVEEKDYFCIIGENGTGKSTLMKGILNLIKPISGTITRNYKTTEIGYLPQLNTNRKDFPASINEIILSGFAPTMKFPFYTKVQKESVKKIIKKFKIDNIAHKSFQELSGGQMQRVMLARALVSDKKILILDEPTTGLDPKASKDLFKLIKESNKDGITILMITHDLNCLSDATNIINLTPNEIFIGTKDKYMEMIK